MVSRCKQKPGLFELMDEDVGQLRAIHVANRLQMLQAVRKEALIKDTPVPDVKLGRFVGLDTIQYTQVRQYAANSSK